jgi:hypothetical protein
VFGFELIHKVRYMENRVINDAILRDYLLGRLDPQVDVVQRIDEQILTDTEFSMSVDVVEDEIIEEYLEGTLSSEDKRAVERHFLRPPERQHKLRTARLFSRYLEAAMPIEKSVEQPVLTRRFFMAFQRGRELVPSFRTFAELAASALFTVSILNLLNQRAGLDMAINQINQQLAQERQRSAALNQQLQSALPSFQPTTVVLNLLRSGLQRGEQQLTEAKINSGTKTLHVEVALSSGPSGRYRVQLRHTGTIVWSRDGVDAIAVPGGAIVKLDVPAEVVPEGVCELVVLPLKEGPISYWFSVSKLK